MFDILGPREAVSEGLTAPKLDRLLVKKRRTHREPGQALDLSAERPVASGAFKPGSTSPAWSQKFPAPSAATAST